MCRADIVRFIKSRRIAWLAHVMRMDDERTSKRILEWRPIGTRIRRRTRKRWNVDIKECMQIMVIIRWRKQCKERAEWKIITVKPKPRVGRNASKRKKKRKSSFSVLQKYEIFSPAIGEIFKKWYHSV